MRSEDLHAVLDAISEEPELPGNMPDGFWETVASLDKDGIEALLRIAVRLTKAGISEQVQILFGSPSTAPNPNRRY